MRLTDPQGLGKLALGLAVSNPQTPDGPAKPPSVRGPGVIGRHDWMDHNVRHDVSLSACVATSGVGNPSVVGPP